MKYYHRYRGEVQVTENCLEMDRISPDPTTRFVELDDEIIEVEKSMVVSKEDRDQFLAEKFLGICYHDWEDGLSTNEDYSFICSKCQEEEVRFSGDMAPLPQVDFSTCDGFFLLWRKACQQEWWHREVGYGCYQRGSAIDTALVDPDNFATFLYFFLQKSK